MRVFILFYIFLLNSDLFSNFSLPNFIGFTIPGLDFQQERDPIKENQGGGFLILCENNDIWFSNHFGIHKVKIDENQGISFEKFFPIYGEPDFLYSYGDIIFVKNNLDNLFLYEYENENLNLIQEISSISFAEFWVNSKYVVISNSLNNYEVYKWVDKKIEKIFEFNYYFYGYNNIIGFGEDEYIYFYIYDIAGGVFAHNIFDNSYYNLRDNYFVPLDGFEGVFFKGKIKNGKLYTISEKDKNYYFYIYDLIYDPLKPKLLGKINIGKRMPYDIILNEDEKKVIIQLNSKEYFLLDISDSSNILIGDIFIDENIFSGKYINLFFGNYLLNNSKNFFLELYQNNGSIDSKFEKISDIYAERFVFPDASALWKDKFAEIFIKLKKFYLYNINFNLDKPLSFLKEIPFPQCINDILPENLNNFQFYFNFFEEKFLILTKENLILSDLNGEGSCINLEWQYDYFWAPENIRFFEDKIFISFYNKGILIYNIKDTKNIFLSKEITVPGIEWMDVYDENYLLTHSLDYKQDLAKTEILKYNIDEPFITDSFTKETYWWAFMYRPFFYKGWVYIYFGEEQIQNDSYYLYYYLFITTRVTSEGKFEFAGMVPFIYAPYYYFYTFPITEYSNYHGLYLAMDLRDLGRPRIADIRRIPASIRKTYMSDETIIFMTNKGYALLDPCGSNTYEELPFGWIDFPSQGAEIEGSKMKVSGWAIDPDGDGVTQIYVILDGEYKEVQITKGILREDVMAAKPDYPEAINSGFEGEIDISEVPIGWHRLSVIAKDGSKNISMLGISDFYKKQQ